MNEEESTLDRAARLWEYRLHQEEIFYQRMNFFLVAESMYFVAFATLFSAQIKQTGILVVVIVLGFLLTVIWSLANRRQKIIIDHIRPIVEQACPSYAEIRLARPGRLFSSWGMLAYWVPIVSCASWVMIFVFVLIG
ncbi:MAG TPA: hypothetical protein PKW95_18680 [bacterium]|nr:hypothetical protein [bacterium]